MTFIRNSNSGALAPLVGRVVEDLRHQPADPAVARVGVEPAVPVLLAVEAADVDGRRRYGELLRREPGEVKRERAWQRGERVGVRHDGRDAEEVRRVRRD